MPTPEIWKNATQATVVVKKIDSRGNTTNEVVRAGGKLSLTPEERTLNMEIAASDALDPFSNGMLTPVRLIEDADDYQEIASNPAHASEDELVGLLKLHYKKFEKAVADIGNEYTLQRLLEVAMGDDSGATVKQVEVIKAKLASVSTVVEVDSDIETFGEPEDSFAPVTPK